MKLSNYLKKERLNRCLSQDEMAKLLDISKVYYCLLETGKLKPGIKLSSKIANVLNIKPILVRRMINVNNK